MERKLNTIKHMIEQQKNDMLAAEQRKNDLIMYLAHDLKTPLASVIGYLNLLRDEGQIADTLREKYLSISLDKAERLEDLINEFFEISKYNLTTISLQYSTINLKRLLEMLLYFSISQKNTNPTAHALLDGKSCLGLLESSPEQLQQTDGVGPASAQLIKMSGILHAVPYWRN